jgi:hypothetical protein
LRTFLTNDKNPDGEIVCFGDQVLNMDNKRVWYVVVSTSREFGSDGLQWCGVTYVRLNSCLNVRHAKKQKKRTSCPPLRGSTKRQSGGHLQQCSLRRRIVDVFASTPGMGGCFGLSGSGV